MHLESGSTRYHGIILNNYEAREFRNMEKRLRRQIDCGHTWAVQDILTEIKEYAGDSETNRQVFEEIRRDADARWKRTWGHSWKNALAAQHVL